MSAPTNSHGPPTGIYEKKPSSVILGVAAFVTVRKITVDRLGET